MQQKLNNLMVLNVHKYKLDDLDLSACLNEFVLYKEVNTETAYLESFECNGDILFFSFDFAVVFHDLKTIITLIIYHLGMAN